MADGDQVPVTVDNYVRAETARMFDGTIERAGGTGRFVHNRVPTPIDQQNVIRMNRDTLYSQGVFDISRGATVTLPEAGDRYMSVMVINEDHYINRVLSKPGSYELTVDEFDSEFVAAFMRLFVDPNDDEDIAAVNALQDELTLETHAGRSFTHPPYAEDDRVRIFNAAAQMGLPDSTRAFGRREDVDPIRHLIATTVGWGGLPDTEAFYTGTTQPQPIGRYKLMLHDVPVDGFWSITIYNQDGFMEPNPYDSYSVNNVTAAQSADGAVEVNLAPEPEGFDNYLYIMDGWGYALRFYRPRTGVLDGSWVAPVPEPA